MTTHDPHKLPVDSPTTTPSRPVTKRPLLRLLLGICVVAVVVLTLILLLNLNAAPYEINAALYIKEGQLHYVDQNNHTAGAVGAALFEKEKEDSVIAGYANTVTSWSGISESGKLLFFPKEPVGSTATLMVRDLTKPEAEPILIDTDVEGNYFVTPDDTSVIYEKQGQVLCYHMDKDTREVLVESVPLGFSGILDISDDRKTILSSNAKDVRLIYEGQDKGTYPFPRLSKDGKRVYFIKEGTLYRLDPKTARETALAAAESIQLVYDDKLYYNGPKKEDGTCALYYYDGKKSVLIAEDYVSLCNYSLETPVLAYTAGAAKKAFVSVADKVYPLEATQKAEFIRVHSLGKALLYYDEVDSQNHVGTLMRMPLEGEHCGKAERYAEGVFYSNSDFIGGSDHVFYYKKTDETLTLYIDQVAVDTRVDLSQTYLLSDVITTRKDTERKFYVTDWDRDEKKGTIKLWDGQSSTVIATEAEQFLSTSKGFVLYLKNVNNGKGELYQWYNGETTKLDDGVSALVPIYRTR